MGESCIYQPSKNQQRAKPCKTRESQSSRRDETGFGRPGDRKAQAEFYSVFFGVGAWTAFEEFPVFILIDGILRSGNWRVRNLVKTDIVPQLKEIFGQFILYEEIERAMLQVDFKIDFG